MRQKLQLKILSRKIKDSFGRFVAIILIIMLGVLLFVGIKSSGPDLYNNAQHYLKEQKASDIQISSPFGLTDADLKIAKQVKNAQVSATKSEVLIEKKAGAIIQLFNYDKQDKTSLDNPKLTKGHFPTNKQELVLDDNAQKDGYQLGQTISFKSKKLKGQSFKISGFITSPLMINKHARPVTTVGDGTIDYFAYIDESYFKDVDYSTINLRFDKFENENSFKDHYQNQVNKKVSSLTKRLNTRAKQKKQELLKPLLNQQKQISTSLENIKKARTNGLNTAELAAQEKELNLAKPKIDNAINQIQSVESIFSFETRHDLAGFREYGELADRITVIANVFPMFFFMIAILITFTTMTRMVEEERTQIGILKALGYSKVQIQQNYLWYATIAAILGIVSGIFIGINTLPRIVMQMMQTQYIFDSVGVTFEWNTVIIVVALALFATIGAVLLVTLRELHEKPAVLMLPKTPKAGKRILLEKIPFIWQRLNFFRKVSYRNLFRFKSRMWMGIIGIAGGTGLILTGFGIRDSINQTAQNQFNDVIRYQAIATFAPDSEKTAARKILETGGSVISYEPIRNEMITISKGETKVDSVTLMIPKDSSKFDKYVKVDTKNLKKNGLILSKKAAQLLKLKVGDQVTLQINEQNYQIKVTAITENYVGHFAYLNRQTYQELLGTNYQANSWLIKTNKMEAQQEDKLAKDLLATKEVVNVSFMSTQLAVLNNQTANLLPIIFIFILLSGMLTFVVLYNLTNVNISERVRELSTIKVLGFFNKEVSMYIIRENIILTFFGIILGIAFGNALLAFILQQAMTSQVIFPLTISVIGYVTSIVLTIIFTGIVSVITHYKLKKINMIDALKAND